MKYFSSKEMEASVLNSLAEKLNYGFVFINEQEKIRVMSPLAEEIMGFTLKKNENVHPAGKINKGDIVILLDNDLGNDDELEPADLKKINIASDDIRKGSVILAIGIYEDKNCIPAFKIFNNTIPSAKLELNHIYEGVKINSFIDFENRRMSIMVDGIEYDMEYLESIGFMVVLDGQTKEVKFFQAKGYGYREEEVGKLLHGKNYLAKVPSEEQKIRLRGDYKDIIIGDEFIDTVKSVMESEDGTTEKGVYQIFRIIVYCHIQRIRKGGEYDGVYIFLQDCLTTDASIDFNKAILQEAERKSRKKIYRLGEGEEDPFGDFMGSSPAMTHVKQLAYKASKTKFNVIITGASGTGKSKLARRIHEIKETKGPFVEVVCNAIAPSLIESELFGYAPKAFTGADSKGKVGFFEKANGGTIFLDEIGEISPDIQVKLLNVLQNKRIYRVGSTEPIDIDVRVITATNRDLEKEVAEGNFRQDLFYRINVFPIHMPPLKDRKHDLLPLANQILKNFCEKYNMKMKKFSEEAAEVLLNYDWPGNVRELENIIERAVTICDGNIIYRENIMIKTEKNKINTLREFLEEKEKEKIEEVYEQNERDAKATMKELGLSKSVFYEKLRKYNINR